MNKFTGSCLLLVSILVNSAIANVGVNWVNVDKAAECGTTLFDDSARAEMFGVENVVITTTMDGVDVDGARALLHRQCNYYIKDIVPGNFFGNYYRSWAGICYGSNFKSVREKQFIKFPTLKKEYNSCLTKNGIEPIP
ncbi:MAG: hypothetical protein ACXVCP_07515 [Bdellovibrio sp.]